MRRLGMKPAAWMGIVFIVLALTAPARGQVLVINVKSLNDVLSAARYLAPFIQKETSIDSLIKNVLGGKDLVKILDGKLPLGMYLDWPADKDQPEGFIFFAPVLDQKALVEMVQRLPFNLKKLDTEIYQIDRPFLGDNLFFRFAQGHVFAATHRPLLSNPAKLRVPGAAPTTLVKASFYPQRIPQSVRDRGIATMKKAFVDLLSDERLPGESDAEYKKRRQEVEKVQAFVTSLVKDTLEVALTADLNERKQQLALELAVVGRPKSLLMDAIEKVGACRSGFTALHKKADLSLSACLPRGAVAEPEVLVDRLAELADPRRRLLARQLVKALQPTLQAANLDVGAAVTLARPQGLAILAGVRVKKARGLENLIRDAIKDATTDERTFYSLRWNHAAHAGTKIHSAMLYAAKKRYFFMAIRAETVLASQDMQLLRDILDALDRPAGAEERVAVQVEAHFRFLQAAVVLAQTYITHPEMARGVEDAFAKDDILAVVESVERVASSRERKAVAARFAKAIGNIDDDQLRLRLRLKGDSALRLQIDFHPRLLALVPVLFAETGPVPPLKGKEDKKAGKP